MISEKKFKDIISKDKITQWLVAAVGLFLSFSLFISEYYDRYGDLESKFKNDVNRLITQFEKKIELNEMILRDIAGLFSTSAGNVTREDFRNFVAKTLETSNFFKALTWVPRIDINDRELFEKNIQNEFSAAFYIKQSEKSGNLIKAETREVHFPIHYIEPSLEITKSFSGYDLFSDTVSSEIMKRSCDECRIIITPAMSIVNFSNSAILCFIPVYKGPRPPESIEKRRTTLKGFVIGIYLIDEMINTTLTQYLSPDVNLAVYDGGTGETSLIYGHKAENLPMVTQKNINIYGRTWSFVFKTSYDYKGGAQTGTIWALSISCLFVTFLTVTIINLLQNYAKSVDIEVDLRTSELQATNYELQTEIKERHRVEGELRKSSAERKASEEKVRKLSQAVEQSPVMVIITDTKGGIEYVNHKFTDISGYQPHEVIGRNPKILKSGSLPASVYKTMWETITNGEEWHGEFYNCKKNGQFYWVFASISPIKNERGEITNFLSIAEDITARKNSEFELKKAKEEADAANNAKSHFLASMSHEIRTPMNSIIGFSDMLNETKLSEEQAEFVKHIRTGSSILLSLISDILDFSKIEAGKFSLEELEFDLNEIIEDVISVTEVSAVEKGIELKHLVDKGIDRNVISDPNKLRQVLLNLVGNAIKFTDTGGVSIAASLIERAADSFTVRFEIKDSGVGIPADKLDVIFSPFVQADGTVARKYGGTGLGLAISDNIVKLFGGKRIYVESKPGEGSNFSFTLTFKTGRTHSEVKSTVVEKTGGNQEKNISYRVLLVEDNILNIQLVTKLLNKRGHRIITAGNGKVSLELTAKEKFDIILMDVQMPVMDGYEATVAIRKAGINTPIIAMTAAATRTDQQACLAAGMDAYIPKPIKINELINLMHEVYDKKNPGPREKSNDILAPDEARPEGEKVFDRAHLMENMDNDEELAREIVKMFLEALPPYLDDIQKAIEEKDPGRLRHFAHKLKGSALNASAMAAAGLLLKLEKMGRENKTDGSRAIFEDVLTAVERYRQAVKSEKII